VIKRRSIGFGLLVAAALAGPAPAVPAEKASKSARMCLDMLSYEQAVVLFDKPIADDPAEEGNRAGKGYALYRLGRLDDAALALRSEIVRNKENWQALTLLPLVHYEKERYEEATQAANEFLQVKGQELTRRARAVKPPVFEARYPNAAVPVFVLGLCAAKKQASAEAEAAFNRAMDFQYPEGECYLQMISGLMARGLWAEAGLTAASAAPRTGEMAEIYVLRGIIADKLGDAGSAEAFFETAQALRPFEDWVVENYAIHDLLAGKPDLAAARLRKAALFVQGDEHFRDLMDLAAKKVKPESGTDGRPFLLEFIEKRKIIWRYIFDQKLIDIDKAANEIVLGMIRNARLNGAAEWLAVFVQIQDSNPGLFYDLAKLYDVAGRPKDALRAAWSAIELKRDFRDAYDLIANVFFQARYYSLSQTYYERAVELSPADPWVHYNLACAYQAAGVYTSAEAIWRKAIELEELEVSRSLPGIPKKEELDVALSVKPDPVSYRAFFGLGGMYAEMGRLEESRNAFYRAADIKPRAPQPHYELGKIALRTNDSKEAEKQFRDYADRGGDKAKIPIIKR
jgi:tetratricopeptide (TPR) repeat protein